MNMDKYRISPNLLILEDRRYFKLQINTIGCKLALIQNSAYIKALKLSKYHIMVAI